MINSTIENQVLKTFDYDQFKTIEGNRDINSRNYTRIMDSMKQKQLVIPIIVNEKMEIIDGQHRFTASKELGLPVYYIIVNGYGIEDVERANTAGVTWGLNDFLKMHLSKGNENYIEFNSLLVRYGINASDLLNIFAILQGKTRPALRTIFEEGNLTLECEDKVLAFLRDLQSFNEFSEYNSSRFVMAFFRLYSYEKYNHKRMRAALKTNSYALRKKTTTGEYIQMLTSDIYSKGSVKEPIYYDYSNDRFYQ